MLFWFLSQNPCWILKKLFIFRYHLETKHKQKQADYNLKYMLQNQVKFG